MDGAPPGCRPAAIADLSESVGIHRLQRRPASKQNAEQRQTAASRSQPVDIGLFREDFRYAAVPRQSHNPVCLNGQALRGIGNDSRSPVRKRVALIAGLWNSINLAEFRPVIAASDPYLNRSGLRPTAPPNDGGADRGLGFLIVSATTNFDLAQAIASVVVLALMSVVLYQIVQQVQKIWLPWSIKAEAMT